MEQINPADKQKRPGRFDKKLIIPLLFISALVLGTFLQKQNLFNADTSASIGNAVKKVELGCFPIVIPTVKWGFALDTFDIYTGIIGKNEFFADVLTAHSVDYINIENLVENSLDVFNVNHWRAGKPYTLLTRNSGQGPDYLVYEPNVFEYFVFDLKNGSCQKHVYPVDTEIQSGAGVIKSSLWNAMIDGGMSFELAQKMEDALQWSIDFHHTQQADAFKLVYDEKYIEGQSVGIGQLHAAWYKTSTNEYYAIYFDSKKNPGYYDLEGRPMNKGFLRSPVKYARISSRFNRRRFHPILKRVRPHLGTDYAAPRGTPILAVGSGVVTAASRSRGNGNYVKIKHDKTYTTQYLHMSRFAKGIRPGVQVKQGQVIGYVGSTGLATGPHVCFRFWKNGKQVNHLRLSFPPPEPLSKDEMPAFEKVRDTFLKKLNATTIKNLEQPELTDNKNSSATETVEKTL